MVLQALVLYLVSYTSAKSIRILYILNQDCRYVDDVTQTDQTPGH